ncbi:MAG: cytochrome c [Pirellulaceae bacterium]|nr:MAG: cytochrome c [Pirellulaceae bacterium]
MEHRASMRDTRWWLGVAWAVWMSWNALGQEVPEEDLRERLPRIAAVEPDQALATFEVLPGFTLELVAAEPLVADPVAFAFDAQGRLFVVEMRGYSEQPEERLGRIALLTDRDGDGVMDHRRDFVTNLSWPTAIWPWKDGVIVAEPPSIRWYRDTDGDGVSDWQQEWFRGFHRSNVQGLVNSFRWGIDCRIHGATSSSGADVEALVAGADGADAASVLHLARVDFAIDPVLQRMEPVGGGGQHGLSFNRWGDKFVTSNSDHLQQVLDIEPWLQLHPSSVPLPALRRSIAVDGPQATVYRASPVEPWRVVRTQMRVQGVVPGPVEGGGTPAGYFTGATGTWIVDQEWGFGAPDGDTALVCDVGSNLVHRKRLVDEGLWFRGERIDAETELLRSNDIWFRPVQLGDGPDGAIYIADMYREVIEHPQSLPPVIKKHLDLTSGRDRGRLWRLKRATAAPTSDRSGIDHLSSMELVQELTSLNPWRRRMASQLLIERHASEHGPVAVPASIGQAILAVVYDQHHPAAQVLALYIGTRLHLLDAGDVQQLLSHAAHPRVIEHGLRVARSAGWRFDDPGLWRKLSRSDSLRVQLQCAMAAADLPAPLATETLAAILAHTSSDLVRAIALVAAGPHLMELVDAVTERLPLAQTQAVLVRAMPALVDGASGEEAWRTKLCQRLAGTAPSPSRRIWLAAASQLDPARRQRLIGWMSAAQQEQLRRMVVEELEATLATNSPTTAAQHIGLARLLPAADAVRFGDRILRIDQPTEVQAAYLQTLRSFDDQEIARLLISRLPQLPPELQRLALQTLTDRAAWSRLLIDAVEKHQLAMAIVPAAIRERLRAQGDASWQQRVDKVFGSTDEDRQRVAESYVRVVDAILQTGDEETLKTVGRRVFLQNCAACHRLGDLGHDVGARLTQLSDKTPAQLVDAILDPNREVDPRFISYTVLTEDERVLTGIIREASSHQIVLVEAGGTQHTLDRASIVRLHSSGISLMPVGLEQQISAEQLAALILFLRGH